MGAYQRTDPKALAENRRQFQQMLESDARVNAVKLSRDRAVKSAEDFKKTGEDTMIGQLTKMVHDRISQMNAERNPPPDEGGKVTGFKQPNTEA